jgi:excisionase family DNA binding protein
MPEKRWITPEELAAELDVQVWTVWRWLRLGRVPGARRLEGGQYRLPADTAERLAKPIDERELVA